MPKGRRCWWCVLGRLGLTRRHRGCVVVVSILRVKRRRSVFLLLSSPRVPPARLRCDGSSAVVGRQDIVVWSPPSSSLTESRRPRAPGSPARGRTPASNALPEEDAEEVEEAGVTRGGSHEASPTKTPHATVSLSLHARTLPLTPDL